MPRSYEIFLLLTFVVNEILSDHNVDKQMTDSRGDVRYEPCRIKRAKLTILGCLFDG